MKRREQQSKAGAFAASSARHSGEASGRSKEGDVHWEREPIWMPEVQAPAPVAVLQLTAGRWIAHIIGVAAELGLADQIQAGPKTAAEIAVALGLDARPLYRLFRALVNVGIFAEQEDGRFVQTPMSDALRQDVPYSVRGVARLINRPQPIRAWTELEHSVRTGASAFEHVHGMQFFDFLDQHPEEMEIFVEAVGNYTAQIGTAVAEAYDFSSIRRLAQLGGSSALAILLAKHPAMRGILFDLPTLLESASNLLRSHGVEDRVELKGGNFFEAVPAGADAYLLQNVLHWWSDEDCVRILRTVRTAAKLEAKLLVVEEIVETSNEPQFAKTMDVSMLVLTGGRERTHAEWRDLLRAGGFRLSRAVSTNSFAYVIEGLPN